MPNPFPELAPFDVAQARRVVPRGETESWLAEEMRRERDRDIRRTIIQAPPPEQVARATRLARISSVPPAMIDGRLEEVERAQNADKLTSLAEIYPSLGRFAASNPRAAVAAQDDTESLSILGNAWEGLKNIGNRLLAGTGESAAGLVESLDLMTFDPILRTGVKFAQPWLRETAAQMRSEGAVFRERGRADSWLAETALSGLESIPVVAAAALTRNPAVATAIPSLSVFGNARAEGRRQGLSETQANVYGGLQGGIEYATERLPMGTLVEAIVKRTPFGKAVVRQLATEIPGEQIATALQDLTDWAMLPENEAKTFGDYLSERPEAAAATAVATVSGTAGQTALAQSVSRTAEATIKVADRLSQASQARTERVAIDRLAKGAEGSKLRQRDPEAFRELVRQQAEDAGADSVFIPGEAVREYRQSDSYDQDNDPFRQYDVDEAAVAGGDIVIPIADALTDLVGTPAWEAVKDHMRLTPGGMSTLEAQTFEESMDDIMTKLGDEQAQSEKSEQAAKSVRDKIVDRVAEAFGVSFTSPTARTIAEIFAQRVQTRATRLGTEISESDLEGFAVKQVMPEGVAEAMAADRGPEVKVLYQNSASLAGHNPQSRYMMIGDATANEQKPGQEADTGDAGGQSVPGVVDPAANARSQEGAEEQIEFFPGADLGVDPNFYGSTIEVDGLERPTLNANGEMIASTRAAVVNFWRWFGDSKMVDKEGRPLVFYHGTSADLESIGIHNFAFSIEHTSTFFFALDRETAENFARDDNVVSAYLAAERVDEYNADGRSWGEVVPLDSDEVSDAQAQWRADQMEKFEERSEIVENDDEALPWRLRLYDGTEQFFDDHDEAAGALEEAIEREREEYEDQLREEEPWEIELAELGYLEREGYSTDYLAGEAMGSYDAVLIHDVDEGVGATTVAIILEQPNAIKSTSNTGAFDPSDPRIMFQSDMSDGPKGRIIFDQNQRIIELFQSRNLSTPLHELSHMWLEELRFDAEQEGAPEQLKADWETTKRYFAANGHAIGADGQIPVEAHELWARSGERYLMEGKAPSSGLVRLFEQFRSWLVNIYKTVDRLRAPITPEIREVFDRLLATDEEISNARETQGLAALFKDAAEIGMSEAEFQAYQRQVDDARAGAHASLLDKTMKAIRRRETERYREARKTVRQEQQERIDGSPLFKALATMKDQRVSREWIVDELGEDAFDLLPVRVPPLYVKGGTHPDVIAEQSGYSTGREMIEALIGAERVQRQAKEGGETRGMRERAIEIATDEEMNRRWGDPLNDGSIEREALAAVHSEMQGEVIASELRVLSRKTGQRPTPYRIAREWARGKVRAGTVREEASPSALQRYARNAAKAGRAAEAAMLKQDADEAFRQKQFQMLNSALLAEAKQAADEVSAAVSRMDKIARAKTRKSVDQDYLEQAQALLEAVDLRKRSQVGIDRQGQWEAFAAAREAEGFDVVVPASFEATLGQTNWSRLPVESLLALDEQIKQIMHLGRLKQELLTAKKDRELSRVADEIQATIREQRPDIMKDWRHRNTLGQRLRSGVRELFAVHRKMSSLARQIDGGRDGGPLVSALILPMTDRYNWEAEQHTEANEKLSAILKPFLGRTAMGRNKMTSGQVFLPSIGQAFNLEERMIIVANMGNAGNMQRLLDGEQIEDGFRWNEADLEAIKNSLTKEQMEAVQAIWDLFESYKPLIAEKERRVNGVEPQWVEPQPVETPHGTYRGGYFPVKYDRARSNKAQQQADADEAKRQMQGAYTASTTRRSFVKERADKVMMRPLRYSFSSVTSGLSEVIHDLAFHEYLIDANRLLRHPRVGGEIRKRYGPEVLKQFTEGLEDVAVGNAPAANAWEAALNHVRFGATIAGLGWNLKTAMLQPFGLTQSIVRVGPKWIARGLQQWTAHPAELPRRVREKSTFMRERGRTMNREVNEIQNRVQGRTASRQVMEASFFYMIVKMQMTVDIPTWWGAYEKAIASDETEVNAVLLADQAVKDAQGGGQIGDLARIQRGGPLMKLWTNFYSFFSTTFNLTAESVARTKFSRPGDVLAFMSDMVLLYSIPAMMGVALDAAFGGGDDDDEDLAAKLAGEQISYAMGTMIGLRELTGLGQSVAEWMTGWDIREFEGAYGGPAGLRALQELDRLGQQAAQGEMDRALRKSAINSAGVLLHLPSGQINKSLDGAMALSEGETENPLVLATGT